MPQIDPSNPEALHEALSGAALFQPEDTPQQKAALARLETAARPGRGLGRHGRGRGGRQPAARRPPRSAEAIRRRRATGGPAERTFATLVGLELRPRRLREAADHLARAHRGPGHRRPGRGVGAPGPAAHRGGLRRPGGVRPRPAGLGHRPRSTRPPRARNHLAGAPMMAGLARVALARVALAEGTGEHWRRWCPEVRGTAPAGQHWRHATGGPATRAPHKRQEPASRQYLLSTAGGSCRCTSGRYSGRRTQ